MRVAGRLASEVLDFITPHVVPGVSTAKLDELCHDFMVNVQGTIPAPLNYAPPGHRPYPKSICTSVNHQVCHGIPGEKTLKAGDIVNIDITVIKDGWHGDTSRMFYVGEPSIQAKRLCEPRGRPCGTASPRYAPAPRWATSATRCSSTPRARATAWCASSAATASASASTRSRRSCTTAARAPGAELKEGMIFTVEPMINAGRRDIKQMNDGWTIVTRDHSLSAQWEHTVVVTADGVEVLTAFEHAPPPPAFIGERVAIPA
jgi:methionyl aminopeptidase